MISLAVAAVMFQPVTVLERGGIGAGDFRYWAVEDTFLDRLAQDQNFGRDRALSGGSDKTILIRFGDLRRVAPSNARIKSATLVLGIEQGGEFQLREVRRMLVGWGEGALSRSTLFGKAKATSRWNSSTWRQRHGGTNPLPWSGGGGLGAGDSVLIADARARVEESTFFIEGLAASLQSMLDRPDENFGWALLFDKPCGFASSDAPSRRPQLVVEWETAATEAPTTPDLVVTGLRTDLPQVSSSGEGKTFRAFVTITNAGQKALPGFRVRWTIADRPGAWIENSTAVDAGKSVEIQLEAPARLSDADPRSLSIVVRAEPIPPLEDPSPWNNTRRVEGGGLPVLLTSHPDELELARSAVDFMNEVALPQSRFSFAPEGALERVRAEEITVDQNAPKLGNMRAWLQLLGTRLGLIVPALPSERSPVGGAVPDERPLDPFPGIMGYGDTREESNLPGGYNVPYDGAFDALIESMRLPVTDLFSATDIAALQAMLGKPPAERAFPWSDLPGVIVVRAMDRGGRPLKGAELQFFDTAGDKYADEPYFKTSTVATNSVTVPNRGGASGKPTVFRGATDLRGEAIAVRATRAGVSDVAWIKPWHLLDTFSRGSKGAGIIDLHFNLTDLPLVPDSNLATDKLVSDKAGRSPGQLAALVDNDPQSILDYSGAEGDWIEIDLGRDRLFGEVRLDLAEGVIPKFDWMVYGTGQVAAEAVPWVREASGEFSKRASLSTDVVYRGPAVRARYLRLVLRGPCASAKIRGIRIVSAREQ
ncbi:MAG: hypothetical protein HONBIEJF_01457 [Fimbriimonadaceae bacterium]|nr:hypothetical protein [Fimbriimonadaceae bacterium]